MSGWILLVIIAVPVVLGVAMYNRLVALRQATTALAEPGRSAARLTLAELGLAPAIAQGTDNG